MNGKAGRFNSLAEEVRKPPTMLSGGGGLVSTAADYNRFLQMLLPRADSPAGELDGVRLLSPRTVAYMGRNHLPGNQDLEQFGRPLNAESPQRGVGFGLGFAVVTRPGRRQVRLLGRRAVLGRRGVHRLLDRPGGGAHGELLHPAHPLVRAPHPLPAAPAGLPGPRLGRHEFRPTCAGAAGKINGTPSVPTPAG